jgi:FkbM family methyltransferase
MIDWKKFDGDPVCLKWSLRDLETLEVVLRHVPGRKAAVQAGGNLGVFPKRLAQEFETVYTFEPAPQLFHALAQNVPERNVIKLQAALGLKHEMVSLARNRRDGSGRPEHDGLTHVAGPGNIPTLMIDDLSLAACDLIYLDIEGFEFFALMGAEETIARCKPVIAVEINSGVKHYGHSAETLRSFICGLGYRQLLKMHSDEVFVPAF